MVERAVVAREVGGSSPPGVVQFGCRNKYRGTVWILLFGVSQIGARPRSVKSARFTEAEVEKV